MQLVTKNPDFNARSLWKYGLNPENMDFYGHKSWFQSINFNKNLVFDPLFKTYGQKMLQHTNPGPTHYTHFNYTSYYTSFNNLIYLDSLITIDISKSAIKLYTNYIKFKKSWTFCSFAKIYSVKWCLDCLLLFDNSKKKVKSFLTWGLLLSHGRIDDE